LTSEKGDGTANECPYGSAKNHRHDYVGGRNRPAVRIPKPAAPTEMSAILTLGSSPLHLSQVAKSPSGCGTLFLSENEERYGYSRCQSETDPDEED